MIALLCTEFGVKDLQVTLDAIIWRPEFMTWLENELREEIGPS